MAYRNLEITVCSANDLKDVNLFSKMDVYVVAMIAEDPRTKQKTPVDKNGGKSPKWNHKLKFIVDETAAQQNRSTLVFRIISDRPLGDRDIGEVSVPVKELLNGVGDDAKKTERIVNYGVRTPSGKAKGTLNFSYKVGDKVDAAASFMDKKYGDEPVMAYPTGTSYAYPPPSQGAAHMYPPPPPHGAAHMYQPPPPGAGHMYPPQHGYPQMAPGYGGYPPQMAQGYPPQQAGGYGYPGQMAQNPKKKKNGMGGLGLGLGAGLLGGLLVGDMVSDMGEMSAYDAGYDDAMGDGFDF